MLPGEDYCDDEYGINPYESFMKRHLQHYGYYTGKNQNYKNQFQQYAEWEKNYTYNLTSSSDDSDSDSDDDDDKNGDSKLQEDLLRTTQLIYSYGESGKMVPRLREPRSLYALNKELGPQQAARWPSDLQVINERIRHLHTVPPAPEPFYKITGFEKCPMVRGEANGGRIVFSYETNSSFFMKSRVGGSRNGCDPCTVNLESDKDTTLIFESRFESGNLSKAVQVGENEYELWLRYDLYTNKHTQWFYFRVSNTRADREYRFTIVNFLKPDSLYNDGMRPVMYSETEAGLNKVGWVRGGQNIKYYKNNIRCEGGRGDRYLYSMTWTARFQHDHDTVYFSHCYPYTYTDLQDYLLELSNDPIKSRICKQRVLCRTLAGNLVYILTITSASQNPEDMKHKKAMVVTSRVHPGESNASWMMKGFLDFVTGNSPDAKLLRDTFIFKVVPMLNPDGVIVGNYRCSLAGRDLNRNYTTALKDSYPSVWHTKTMIRKLLMERDIIVYCDLHGHSRRQNVFLYGCEQRHNSNKRFHEKIFPAMLSKNTPEKFSFKSCKFKVQKSKEGTGRVVMWNMGIMNSYTMEATFCGSSLGKKKGFHFNEHDFEMMGYHFCDTLLDYCDPDNTKYTKILVDLEDKHQMEVMTKIAQKGLQPENVDIQDLSTDTESSDGGSDSSVSDGPPVHLQYAAARPKKKKLKSKKDRDKVRTGKEDLKKVPPSQEEKRMRNNQIKPLKQDPSKLQGQPMRYTSTTSPRRRRSLDDRSNSGIPVFVQERFEEKQQKRHDYLEALTAAYINNNIPIVKDPAFVKMDRSYARGETDSDTPASNSGLRQPDPFAPAKTRQKRPMTVATAAAWYPGVLCFGRQSVVHFRYSGSSSDRPVNPNGYEGLCAHHEQTLAAQYAAAHAGSGGDSAFKISRLVGRREAARCKDLFDPSDTQPETASDPPNMEDLLRAHLAHPSSINPLDRRHKPHLLEVSAAQQRQTDALSRDKNSPIKTHPNPFDEKAESARKDSTSTSIHPKTNVPSATAYVNYNTFNVTQMKDPNNQSDGRGEEGEQVKSGHRDRVRSGRKSRKGMRQEDEENFEFGTQSAGDIFSPADVQSHPPRVRSAHTSSNMATALSSIQEIQNSLQTQGDGETGATPDKSAAGEYIQQLIKETNEEIQDLTHEIQEDIEKKHNQKSKNVSQRLFRENLYHKKNVDTKEGQGRHQRVALGMGYHGSTFVNDLGPSKAQEDRHAGGYLAGRATGTSAAPVSSVQPMNKISHQQRSEEPLSYSGASMPMLDASKMIGGPNLIIANNRHRETPIEEEARTRSLKRQASFTNNPMPDHGSSIKNTNSPVNIDNTPDSLGQSVHGHKNGSHEDSYRQLSASLQNQFQGYSHSPSGPRLNRQNLVFRTGGPGEGVRTRTPRGPSQQSEHLDCGDLSEQSRARSARSSTRQVVEAVPTKISLMICSDHQEGTATAVGQFLPVSRQGSRPSLYRQHGRKK